MSVPDSLDLPVLHPFGAEDDPLSEFAGLGNDDAAFLRDRYAWAPADVLDTRLPARVGVIHGDANVGYVLLDEHGKAVLIDVDSFSSGAREWDLIQTALFFDRLGWHTEDEYRHFVEV